MLRQCVIVELCNLQGPSNTNHTEDYTEQKSTELFIFQVYSIFARILGNIDGLVQDFNNCSTLAMELLQSCTRPLI